MNRAYSIKRNGKVIKTVGGEKAGRFTTNTTPKPKKRLRKRQTRKQRHILAPLIPILWILLIATGCTGICELNEMSRQPLTAEPMKQEIKVEVAEAKEPEPEDYFVKYFGQDSETIRAICKAENHEQDPNAIHRNRNGSVDQGLCQINTINVDKYVGENIFDPEINIKTAKKIYDSQGWTAWTQYKNGEYLKYKGER